MDEPNSPLDSTTSSAFEKGWFTPSFYRIIMPSVVCEHRLVLPKNFVEEYGDELSSKIELDLPAGGDKWYIGLQKSGDLLYLHVGWEKFMNHYSIRFGWFLLFKYKGNSFFDVHIFDLKATEIQYPLVGHNRNFGKSSPTNGNAVCKEEFDDEEIGEKERVVDAAGKMYENKTVNPSFSVKLRDNNVGRRYSVHLPIEFMRKHMDDCPEFIKIVDSDKKVWHIRCINYGGRRSLGKGWQNFVKEKELKIGDLCVFELVKKNEILKVDVFYGRRKGET